MGFIDSIGYSSLNSNSTEEMFRFYVHSLKNIWVLCPFNEKYLVNIWVLCPFKEKYFVKYLAFMSIQTKIFGFYGR